MIEAVEIVNKPGGAMYKFSHRENVEFFNYWYVKDMFQEDEIDKIHSLASKSKTSEAGMGMNSNIDRTLRSTEVRWLPQRDGLKWVYDRIGTHAEKGNKALWNFDLTHMREDIQYSTYHSETKDHYTWHSDINGSGVMTQRKVSCVVFLDEQGIDYEGGDLLANTKGVPWTIPVQKKGTGVFFPSFWLHKVTPVTKGTRRTLVIWMGGEPFK